MEGCFILIRWVNRNNGLRKRNPWIDEMLKVQEKEVTKRKPGTLKTWRRIQLLPPKRPYPDK